MLCSLRIHQWLWECLTTRSKHSRQIWRRDICHLSPSYPAFQLLRTELVSRIIFRKRDFIRLFRDEVLLRSCAPAPRRLFHRSFIVLSFDLITQSCLSFLKISSIRCLRRYEGLRCSRAYPKHISPIQKNATPSSTNERGLIAGNSYSQKMMILETGYCVYPNQLVGEALLTPPSLPSAILLLTLKRLIAWISCLHLVLPSCNHSCLVA